MMTNMDLLEEIARECGLDKNTIFIRSPFILKVWAHQPDSTSDGYYINFRIDRENKRLFLSMNAGSYDGLNVLLADPDSIKMAKEWVRLGRARHWVRRQIGDVAGSQEMYVG